MASNALLDNVHITADPDSGAPALQADVHFVGSSVTAGRTTGTIAVALTAADTTATVGSKALTAIDALATALGLPAPTNVVGPSIVKLR